MKHRPDKFGQSNLYDDIFLYQECQVTKHHDQIRIMFQAFACPQ